MHLSVLKQTVPLLREGDLLVIYPVDRLWRDYNEIRKQWKHITKTLRADIRVLDMPLLDTRNTDSSGLERTFITDLVLQILSYCAQKERENILARQRIDAMKIVDGKKVSLKIGRPTGRPETGYPEHWDEFYRKWKDKQLTGFACRKILGLKTNTFYKLVHLYESAHPPVIPE